MENPNTHIMTDPSDFIILFFDELFKDEEKDIFYSSQWFANIEEMTELQFMETFRMNCIALKKLFKK